ncbi:MAG: TonB-dependent receptor [Marinoscillum sp.]
MKVLLCFLLINLTANAQHNFKGRVLDKNGLKIQGANIKDDDNNITYTDNNGDFYIFSKKNIINIEITHVGYLKKFDTINISETKEKIFIIKDGILLKDQIKVLSTRAKDDSPYAYENLTLYELNKNNTGKDIPYLLDFTPSVTITSDAGGGIGYTGIRIRGSDANRINVTINGIPYNDAESHGVFWVDLPDIASSTNTIQIQRGVGSSTNGGGAFGGTISIKTGTPSEKAYVDYGTSMGSFNTFKNTLNLNSGIIKQHWNFALRLSKITSDGYVDRAFSNLGSYYASATYFTKKSSFQLINFSGKEKTYQSWWGTPESRVFNDLNGMQKVIVNNDFDEEQKNNLLSSGRTYNYYTYKNEIDDYKQDHYQFHFNHDISNSSNLHFALHYTYGRGFYEQFRKNEPLSNYFNDYENVYTNLVRRRWLDNDFFGFTYSYFKRTTKTELTIGGAYNIYKGDHFGKIISTNIPNMVLKNPYYLSRSDKKDANIFIKYNWSINYKLKLFADMQIRNYSHNSDGSDNDRSIINFDSKNTFFNPKIGFNLKLNPKSNIYSSVSVANREPIRIDFLDSYEKPKHETLYDFEFGYNINYNLGFFKTNLYWMEYKNQLITTGELNDIGGYIRTNAKKSRRVGVEISNRISIKKFNISSSLTLSKNFVYNFNEILYDYGSAFDQYNIIKNTYLKSNIAFSPEIIGYNKIEYKTLKNVTMSFKTKYVGKQYLDNTSNINRSINSYLINSFDVEARLNAKGFKKLFIKFSLNNMFNKMYSSNGYTFGYYAGTDYEVRENYLYPQAGRNYIFSLNIKI